jgi:hypothetical protein
MHKMLLKLLKNIHVMLLHVLELQGHLQATHYKDSNSLYANHTVFPRYAIDVPSYLFELVLCLRHVRCVVFHCVYQALPCIIPTNQI